MRAVVQRVSKASVVVNGKANGSIERGLLVFLGVGQEDTEEDIAWLASKICGLRVFEDEEGKMNLPLTDIGGGILLISQFTLFGHMKKGFRPSFNRAAPPSLAIPLYEKFHKELERLLDKTVPTGCFGEMMDINAHNDGPVTLILDTKQRDF